MADMRDSIAPSIATVIAGTISVPSNSIRIAGQWRPGNPEGIPPNLVPIVSTGNLKATTTTVPRHKATIAPGMRFDIRLARTMMPIAASASPVARGDHVEKPTPSVCSLGTNSLGTFSMARPKKSRICVLAINTAMPLVKPTTTGRGMNRTADPIPVAPNTTSITPAITVQTNSPSTPWSATMPATMTTKAPVGPPIWSRDPPSSEINPPAMMAV